jgi:hypothetical protein
MKFEDGKKITNCDKLRIMEGGAYELPRGNYQIDIHLERLKNILKQFWTE